MKEWDKQDESYESRIVEAMFLRGRRRKISNSSISTENDKSGSKRDVRNEITCNKDGR